LGKKPQKINKYFTLTKIFTKHSAQNQKFNVPGSPEEILGIKSRLTRRKCQFSRLFLDVFDFSIEMGSRIVKKSLSILCGPFKKLFRANFQA